MLQKKVVSDIVLTKKIGHTTYTVTGSLVGNKPLSDALKRVVVKQATEIIGMEDSNNG